MGDARDWITALPPWTIFRVDAVPGAPAAARSLLSRLVAAERPVVGRIARGLYYREPPPAHHAYRRPSLSEARMAQAYLPTGSGLAGYSALEAVGWTTQIPVRMSFALTRRGLRPPGFLARPPEIVARSNLRRNRLTWHEVTLLEAARAFPLCDRADWDEALFWLREVACLRGGTSALIRKDALLWAAETERARRHWTVPPDSPDRFEAVMARLDRDLPDRLPKA